MKKLIRILGIVLLALVLLAAAFIAYLTATEYLPTGSEPAPLTQGSVTATAAPGDTLTILTWNTGYAGLDAGADFFMDGGSMVNPTSQEAVEANMKAIGQVLLNEKADVYLLQELDRNSSRTGHVDQPAFYGQTTGLTWVYGVNYRCKFVPYPWPPLGTMESGIVTMTGLATSRDAARVALPCPFDWPVRAANIKRCLLVTRHPLEGTDKELVVVNLHLEAYDDGEGKAAQTEALLGLLEEEYAKGNYVIAGGDFNQTFPGALDRYPIQNPDLWTPGTLEDSILPEGWQFVYDDASPTCRLLNKPYDPASGDTQFYVIDGFLVSPNVTVEAVENLDLVFRNSDHTPVRLTCPLQP